MSGRVAVLPCPFCGSVPEVKRWLTDDVGRVIGCKNLFCEAEPMVAGETLLIAQENWNRRATPAAVAELVAAGSEWCALMPGLAGGPEFDRLVAALANVGGAA